MSRSVRTLPRGPGRDLASTITRGLLSFLLDRGFSTPPGRHFILRHHQPFAGEAVADLHPAAIPPTRPADLERIADFLTHARSLCSSADASGGMRRAGKTL